MSCNNDLPRSYIGTTAERDWKDLLRYRVGLVRIGTRLRVRLRNVAQRYGARLPSSDVDSAKGRRLWAAWDLRPTHRLIVDDLLTVLTAVDERISGVEQAIEAYAPRMAPARPVEILDSLPGLGRFGALLAAAEIGDWRRFPRPQSLPCYAGLVPSEDSSGDRVIRGRITKEGSCYLRWIMVQAAMKAECSPRMDAFYQRVAQRRGALKARVAVARELLEIAWHLLHKDVLYEERTPRGVEGVKPNPVGEVSREVRGTPEKIPKSRRSGQFAGPQTR
jgi:transposase